MKLVIASGKGGAGKTTVATNLAVTLARHGQAVAYVDCDYVVLVTEPTPFGLHVESQDPVRAAWFVIHGARMEPSL